MRASLLVLLLLGTAAPSAQVPPPTPEQIVAAVGSLLPTLSPGDSLNVLGVPLVWDYREPIDSGLYRGGVTGPFASFGSLVGAATVGIGLVATDFVLGGDTGLDGVAPALIVVGSAVGAASLVYPLGREQPRRPGFVAGPRFRDGDWGVALVGIAAGTLAGTAVAATMTDVDNPEGPFWPVIAIPVLQGLGAGVAVGLR